MNITASIAHSLVAESRQGLPYQRQCAEVRIHLTGAELAVYCLSTMDENLPIRKDTPGDDR